jgi:hydroxymethylpyrimidine/phosphomethylpyrimidine kinase
LLVIVKKLKQLTPHIKIVLDPILKATAGATFHRLDDLPILDAILSEIYLITPNYEEIQCVYPEKSIQDTIEHISTRTNLYLKGGHRTDNVGLDQLYYNKIIQLNIPPGDLKILPKHGSGCVLSSAIASNLMLGYTIEDAAILGKKYIEQFLSSNTTLLGNHKSVNK